MHDKEIIMRARKQPREGGLLSFNVILGRKASIRKIVRFAQQLPRPRCESSVAFARCTRRPEWASARIYLPVVSKPRAVWIIALKAIMRRKRYQSAPEIRPIVGLVEEKVYSSLVGCLPGCGKDDAQRNGRKGVKWSYWKAAPERRGGCPISGRKCGHAPQVGSVAGNSSRQGRPCVALRSSGSQPLYRRTHRRNH